MFLVTVGANLLCGCRVRPFTSPPPVIRKWVTAVVGAARVLPGRGSGLPGVGRRSGAQRDGAGDRGGYDAGRPRGGPRPVEIGRPGRRTARPAAPVLRRRAGRGPR